MKRFVTNIYLVVELPETEKEIKEYKRSLSPSEVDEFEATQKIAGSRDKHVGEHTATSLLVEKIGRLGKYGIREMFWPRVDGYECPLDGSTYVGAIQVDSNLGKHIASSQLSSAEAVADIYHAAVMKRLLTGGEDD